MLRHMAMRTLASRGALRGLVAALATLLLLFVVNVTAGPGQCATEAVCRVDTSDPTGCAPAPPCDGPGPSLQTVLILALLVGMAAGVVAVLRDRGRRG